MHIQRQAAALGMFLSFALKQLNLRETTETQHQRFSLALVFDDGKVCVDKFRGTR
jgi:hypothetical protein